MAAGGTTADTYVRRTNVWLVRHGETEGNALGLVQGQAHDYPLNEKGQGQARQLAAALTDVEPFDVIASSPLLRAKETAQIVANAQEARLEPVALAEVSEMAYGDLEGKKLSEHIPVLRELSKEWASGNVHLSCPGEGGESPAQVLERALCGLSNLILETKARNLLVVAHARLNQVLLSHIGNPRGLSQMHKVQQENCCANILVFDHATGRFEVAARNIVFDGVTQSRL
mmetsp:Transcript_13200/g.23448  ORF Transcript_13200/g.23448 Transcript_13200/m.23448 type:complete len:229 (-) Transcript_13200:59-745(-)